MKRKNSQIDRHGFRPNVGIVLCNCAGQLLLCRRFQQSSWQFPQGGIDLGESIQAAMYRELYEELGLTEQQVQIVTQTRSWLPYRLPKRLLHSGTNPTHFVGQKQRWFLLLLLADTGLINFNVQADIRPEFDAWKWVSYWYPIRKIVNFKRTVYSRMLAEFAPVLNQKLASIAIEG